MGLWYLYFPISSILSCTTPFALCWYQSVCNIPHPLLVGLLVRLHTDDPVSAGGLLLLGGFHPDDCVGQGKAPQLPEGVPWLPSSPFTHPSLRPVDNYMAAPSPAIVGVKFNPTSPPKNPTECSLLFPPRAPLGVRLTESFPSHPCSLSFWVKM